MRRWTFAALGLLLTMASVAWAWPTASAATLSDAELTDLWGGRDQLWCSSANAIDCDGYDFLCCDLFSGPNPGDPCWPDTTGIEYFSPEACGSSQHDSPGPCTNPTSQYVHCTTTSTCHTVILSNGAKICDDKTWTSHYRMILTDMNKCRWIVLAPPFQL
jgi:hypothetical protein